MRLQFLKLLKCVDCKGRLSLRVFKKEGEEIREGKLSCNACNRSYPVINSIPRMLPAGMMGELVWKKFPGFLKKYGKKFKGEGGLREYDFEMRAKSLTSKSFGFEWTLFSEVHPHYRKQFLDWLAPFKPSILKGKLVLDAGCGMGRHLLVASEYAEEIVGIDFSEGVDAAYGNLKGKGNVHLVQADIYNLPFGKEFDFIYSIGVLHHLPHPEKGFRALLKHVKSGGKIFVWLYGREGNSAMVHIIEPFRKYFTSKLPHQLLYYLCFPVTILLELGCLLYRLLNSIPLIKNFAEYLPSYAYLLYISKFTFRHKLAIVFDFLSAPLARYYRKEEFESWFKRANLSPKIYHHNNNSWKALAEVR